MEQAFHSREVFGRAEDVSKVLWQLSPHCWLITGVLCRLVWSSTRWRLIETQLFRRISLMSTGLWWAELIIDIKGIAFEASQSQTSWSTESAAILIVRRTTHTASSTFTGEDRGSLELTVCMVQMVISLDISIIHLSCHSCVVRNGTICSWLSTGSDPGRRWSNSAIRQYHRIIPLMTTPLSPTMLINFFQELFVHDPSQWGRNKSSPPRIHIADTTRKRVAEERYQWNRGTSSGAVGFQIRISGSVSIHQPVHNTQPRIVNLMKDLNQSRDDLANCREVHWIDHSELWDVRPFDTQVVVYPLSCSVC